MWHGRKSLDKRGNKHIQHVVWLQMDDNDRPIT